MIYDWERLALMELYDEYEQILWRHRIKILPATIEIFESSTLLGQWDSMTRTIRISRGLLRTHPWFHVVGVLSHEMAHQLAEEQSANRGSTAHGVAFQVACMELGVTAEFAKATGDLPQEDLNWHKPAEDGASAKMLEKVRKLLALATSANEHEALSAMNRVREIYAKYNLEQADQPDKARFVCLGISTGSKRFKTHEKRIGSILIAHFFVRVINGDTYHVPTGERHAMVEIFGTPENVLMAEYVYHFLVNQTQLLVAEAERSGQHKFTRTGRNSYRLGILNGFSSKLTQSSTSPSAGEDDDASIVSRALTVFKGDRRLDTYIRTIYPRLTFSGSGARIDPSAYAAGHVAGHTITLNKPVTGAATNHGHLLGGSK